MEGVDTDSGHPDAPPPGLPAPRGLGVIATRAVTAALSQAANTSSAHASAAQPLALNQHQPNVEFSSDAAATGTQERDTGLNAPAFGAANAALHGHQHHAFARDTATVSSQGADRLTDRLAAGSAEPVLPLHAADAATVDARSTPTTLRPAIAAASEGELELLEHHRYAQPLASTLHAAAAAQQLFQRITGAPVDALLEEGEGIARAQQDAAPAQAPMVHATHGNHAFPASNLLSAANTRQPTTTGHHADSAAALPFPSQPSSRDTLPYPALLQNSGADFDFRFRGGGGANAQANAPPTAMRQARSPQFVVYHQQPAGDFSPLAGDLHPNGIHAAQPQQLITGNPQRLNNDARNEHALSILRASSEELNTRPVDVGASGHATGQRSMRNYNCTAWILRDPSRDTPGDIRVVNSSNGQILIGAHHIVADSTSWAAPFEPLRQSRTLFHLIHAIVDVSVIAEVGRDYAPFDPPIMVGLVAAGTVLECSSCVSLCFARGGLDQPVFLPAQCLVANDLFTAHNLLVLFDGEFIHNNQQNEPRGPSLDHRSTPSSPRALNGASTGTAPRIWAMPPLMQWAGIAITLCSGNGPPHDISLECGTLEFSPGLGHAAIIDSTISSDLLLTGIPLREHVTVMHAAQCLAATSACTLQFRVHSHLRTVPCLCVAGLIESTGYGLLWNGPIPDSATEQSPYAAQSMSTPDPHHPRASHHRTHTGPALSSLDPHREAAGADRMAAGGARLEHRQISRFPANPSGMHPAAVGAHNGWGANGSAHSAQNRITVQNMGGAHSTQNGFAGQLLVDNWANTNRATVAPTNGTAAYAGSLGQTAAALPSGTPPSRDSQPSPFPTRPRSPLGTPSNLSLVVPAPDQSNFGVESVLLAWNAAPSHTASTVHSTFAGPGGGGALLRTQYCAGALSYISVQKLPAHAQLLGTTNVAGQPSHMTSATVRIHSSSLSSRPYESTLVTFSPSGRIAQEYFEEGSELILSVQGLCRFLDAAPLPSSLPDWDETIRTACFLAMDALLLGSVSPGDLSHAYNTIGSGRVNTSLNGIHIDGHVRAACINDWLSFVEGVARLTRVHLTAPQTRRPPLEPEIREREALQRRDLETREAADRVSSLDRSGFQLRTHFPAPPSILTPDIRSGWAPITPLLEFILSVDPNGTEIKWMHGRFPGIVGKAQWNALLRSPPAAHDGAPRAARGVAVGSAVHLALLAQSRTLQPGEKRRVETFVWCERSEFVNIMEESSLNSSRDYAAKITEKLTAEALKNAFTMPSEREVLKFSGAILTQGGVQNSRGTFVRNLKWIFSTHKLSSSIVSLVSQEPGIQVTAAQVAILAKVKNFVDPQVLNQYNNDKSSPETIESFFGWFVERHVPGTTFSEAVSDILLSTITEIQAATPGGTSSDSPLRAFMGSYLDILTSAFDLAPNVQALPDDTILLQIVITAASTLDPVIWSRTKELISLKSDRELPRTDPRTTAYDVSLRQRSSPDITTARLERLGVLGLFNMLSSMLRQSTGATVLERRASALAETSRAAIRGALPRDPAPKVDTTAREVYARSQPGTTPTSLRKLAATTTPIHAVAKVAQADEIFFVGGENNELLAAGSAADLFHTGVFMDNVKDSLDDVSELLAATFRARRPPDELAYPNLRCTHCTGKGHSNAPTACPSSNAAISWAKTICFLCGGTGHPKAQCTTAVIQKNDPSARQM